MRYYFFRIKSPSFSNRGSSNHCFDKKMKFPPGLSIKSIAQPVYSTRPRLHYTGSDLGLWDDGQVESLKRLVDFVYGAGARMTVTYRPS